MGILQPRRRRHVGWKDTGGLRWAADRDIPLLASGTDFIRLFSHFFLVRISQLHVGKYRIFES